MLLVRDTPFEVGWLVWSLSPPRVSLTVIVKATFTITPDKPCEIAARQVGCTGDAHHDDELEQSVRYESDFAVIKKRGECFLIGTCHPPRGAPTGVSAVAFSVGSVKKALAVYGDRRWTPKLLGHAPSDPVPFTRMPLRWERSFGGPSFAANPLGIGIEDVEGGDAPARPLPNIEDPQALISSMRDRPAPAGAFPIPRGWARRARVAGTFDSAWQKTRWPWLPADFDLAYFNAAPLDQQIDGFWQGDEEITLQQLMPDKSRVTTRLPGVAPRAFVDRGTDRFDELRLHLDTITVDADAGQVLCVWRGLAEVEAESIGAGSAALTEVRHLFVAHESIYGARKSKAAYADRLAAVLAGAAAEEAALAPEVPDETPIAERVEAPSIEEDENRIPELVQAKAQLRAVGIDVDAELARVPTEMPVASLTELKAELRRRFIAAELEVPPELETLGEEPATPPSTSETTEAAEPDPQARAASRREQVRSRLERKESLAFEDLSGADLHDLDLSGADLRAALLTDANLRGATFDRAVLDLAVMSGADAEGASFVDASLRGADLVNVSAPRARFERALLDDALLSSAVLTNANLKSASCKGAHLVGASLRGARLEAARLDRSDLSGADLEGAGLANASLVDATLHGVRATGVSMDGADLTKLRASEGAVFREASFQRCKAVGSRWSGSDLGRATFSGSDLHRADFTDASLVAAKLDECNLVSARFLEARMAGTSMLRSNAFEASFEGADLSRADLRGSSFFGAQLWRARTTGALLDQTDLGRTQLAR